MDELLFAALLFRAGLIIIVYAGDGFVKNAVEIAEIFRIPALYIGTFLIGFSTSVPELIVAYIAALSGSTDLSVGNVLGSYICNIGFVIGITAMVKPLKISTETLARAIPLLALSLFVTAFLLIIDNQFNYVDGLILLALFCVYLVMCFFHINRNRSRFTRKSTTETTIKRPVFWPCCMFIVFLGLLLLGSEMMVEAARDMARHFNVSELVIGITVVALGTSLPELTACIISVLRNEDDIAVGNIVGSNIFCLLCVLSIPLLLAPANGISTEKLWIPLTMMLVVTAVLWIFSAKFDKTCQISRWEGLFLVAISTAYLVVTMTS